MYYFKYSKIKLLNLSLILPYFPPFLLIVISPSPTASNIGVNFYSTLSCTLHITAITKSANYHMFSIRQIRKSLTVALTKTLDNSTVLSVIGYNILITVLHFSSIFPYILSFHLIKLFFYQSIQYITYVFETIHLLLNTNT